MYENHETLRIGDSHLDYVRATQGGVVRLDATSAPSSIGGLCTDGLSACIGIIFVNEDFLRFSLSHTDLAFSEQALLDECSWVGSPCTIYLVRGVYYTNEQFVTQSTFLTKTLPRIRTALENRSEGIRLDVDTYCAYEAGSVAISRSGKIELPENNNHWSLFNRLGYVGEYAGYRLVVNTLNGFALGQQGSYHGLDVQYETDQWTALPVLNQQAKKLIKLFKKNGALGHKFIDENLQGYLDYLSLYEDRCNETNREAISLYKEEKYDKAINLFNQALELRLILDERHETLDQSAIYYNRGSAFMHAGYSIEGCEDLTCCLNIRKSLLASEGLIEKAQIRLEECEEKRARVYQV